MKPPCTERYARWCERTGANRPLLLDPDLPAAQNAPDLFSGVWWPRWDLVLHFNEIYDLQPEDVGSIETVSVEAEVARH